LIEICECIVCTLIKTPQRVGTKKATLLSETYHLVTGRPGPESLRLLDHNHDFAAFRASRHPRNSVAYSAEGSFKGGVVEVSFALGIAVVVRRYIAATTKFKAAEEVRLMR
jgi:hypothetical protein